MADPRLPIIAKKCELQKNIALDILNNLVRYEITSLEDLKILSLQKYVLYSTQKGDKACQKRNKHKRLLTLYSTYPTRCRAVIEMLKPLALEIKGGQHG